MITFCFILAQGGCENQLRGHTAGNFGVGNDKEKTLQRSGAVYALYRLSKKSYCERICLYLSYKGLFLEKEQPPRL